MAEYMNNENKAAHLNAEIGPPGSLTSPQVGKSLPKIPILIDLVSVLGILVLVDILIARYAPQRVSIGLPLMATTICLNILLSLFFLLGRENIQQFLVIRLQSNQGLTGYLLLLLFGTYLLYAFGTLSFAIVPFLKLTVYILSPTLIILIGRKLSGSIQILDFLAVLALWLPLDFRWTRDAWSWPNHSLAYSLNSLLATCLATFLFAFVRQIPDIGYAFRVRSKEVLIGIYHFLGFAPIAIPIALATGFVHFSGRFDNWGRFLLSFVGIFIFIAVPEELLFRGIIQNFLQRCCLSPLVSLAATSVLFGAAHLNNGPRPDWRYFLLATVAGLFYGNAYRLTRNLMAPAIVHTLVDTVWRSFFR
jgi:membrane protease YdiL (CAAX protease family)